MTEAIAGSRASLAEVKAMVRDTKDAEPGVPILIEAKKEYAALK